MFRALNTAKHIMAALFAYKVTALCTSNLHFIKCCSTATHKTQFWWNLGWEGAKPQAPSSYCTWAMPWGLLQGIFSPAEVRTPAGPWALGPAACQAVVGSLDVCTVACLACCFGGDGLVGGFSTAVPSWRGHHIWSFVLPPLWWLPLQPTPVMVAGMAQRGLHCCAVVPEPGSLPTSLPLLLAPSKPNVPPWNQHVLFCPHLQENPALPLGWASFPRGCPPHAAPQPSQLIGPMLAACGPTATPASFEPIVGKQCPLSGEEQGKAPLAPSPRGRRMRGQQSHQAQSAIARHSGGYPPAAFREGDQLHGPAPFFPHGQALSPTVLGAGAEERQCGGKAFKRWRLAGCVGCVLPVFRSSASLSWSQGTARQSGWRGNSTAPRAVQLPGPHRVVTSSFLPRQGHTTPTVPSKVRARWAGGIVTHCIVSLKDLLRATGNYVASLGPFEMKKLAYASWIHNRLIFLFNEAFASPLPGLWSLIQNNPRVGLPLPGEAPSWPPTGTQQPAGCYSTVPCTAGLAGWAEKDLGSRRMWQFSEMPLLKLSLFSRHWTHGQKAGSRSLPCLCHSQRRPVSDLLRQWIQRQFYTNLPVNWLFYFTENPEI